MSPRKYDSTVARIAGNILSGQGAFNMASLTDPAVRRVAEQAVRMARAIVAEVERTEIPNENAAP
jgi:hypothetical protein